MSSPDKIRFFTDLAAVWDSRQDLPHLASELSAGLQEIALGCRETVLDVGCGTGNLTAALLDGLDSSGRVIACDLAPAMVALARTKCRDSRVRWHVADAEHLPLASESVDRVICFSVWPHFDDARRAAVEMARVLRGGGRLHVWHLISRHRVNEIHTTASPAVSEDLLASGEATAEVLRTAGLSPTQVVDDRSRYLVTAGKFSG